MLNPSSESILTHLKMPQFIKVNAGEKGFVSTTESYSKKWVLSDSWRADWSGRQLCFERSDLMKRDGSHPDTSLIVIILWPFQPHRNWTWLYSLAFVFQIKSEKTSERVFLSGWWSSRSVRLYQLHSVFISLFFSSFLLVPSHAGPACGPRSRVSVGAVGFAGLRGG